MHKKATRILVYRTGSLGDSIMTLPCFHKIRKEFPEAHIILLTNKPVVTKAAPLEAVLGNRYFFDEVVNYELGLRSPKMLLRLVKKIRNLKADLLINLATTRFTPKEVFRDKLFFWACGIHKVIGIPSASENARPPIDPATGELEWEAKRLARRLDVLGQFPIHSDEYWDLLFTDDEKADALRHLSPFDPGKVIAMCAGTKMQAKDWERNNWIALVESLKKDLGDWKLVMIGAPDEAAIADECMAAWGENSVNLCGKTSPRISGAVLKHANVYVGHDSGPMHLAACVGIPVVAIFSARNLPRQWFPRGENNKIIYHKVDCAGCFLEVCIAQKKKCILSITVDEVKTAIFEVLDKKPVLYQAG